MEIIQQQLHALILNFLMVVVVRFKAEEIQHNAARHLGKLKSDHTLYNLTNAWEFTTTSSPWLLLPFPSPLLFRATTSANSGHDDDTSINQNRLQKENIPTETNRNNAMRVNFTNITFKKCCAEDEHFDPHLRCVKINVGRDLIQDILRSTFTWFPSTILVDSEMKFVSSDHLKGSHIRTEYGYKPLCDESESMILQWNHGEPSLFSIFIANGSLVEMERNHVVGMWSPDSYCLDAVESPYYRYHVGMLCPCLHVTCVRKCCPRGYYYNLSYNLCTEFGGFVQTKIPYRPKFFNGKSRAGLISYYLLRAMPPCAGKKIEMLHSNRVGKDFPVYIQTNGSLAAPGLHFSIINNSRYCSDIFIDSFGKRTVNVLYCIRHSSRYSDDNTHVVAKGDFFTINSLLFLIALLLILL